MSYVQIQYGGGYITRSPTLGTIRDSGYPTYVAQEQGNPSLVSTILYEDSTGIYLTERKDFILTQIGEDLLFSANPRADPYIPSGTRREWDSRWANMTNTDASYNGLVWPFQSADRALSYVIDKDWPIAIYTPSTMRWATGAWIENEGASGIVRNYEWLHWDRRPSMYSLIPTQEGQYGLRFTDTYGRRRWVTNYDNLDSDYIRLVTATQGLSGSTKRRNMLAFDLRYKGSNATYDAIVAGKKITWESWWPNEYAVSFGSNNNPPITIIPVVIASGISDMDRYLLKGNTYVHLKSGYDTFYPPYDPMAITPNLPRGISCPTNAWSGDSLACYDERIPYTGDVGRVQCTTLDSLSNDTHCQLWAIENSSPTMDAMLTDLCQDQGPEGPYHNICACYLPDDIYYDTILEEAGERVAQGVRRTSLLPCASGLCTGGNTSGDIYYRGSRRCDVCIQVMNTNINADKVSGNISLRQRCTSVEDNPNNPLTWDRFIDDLTRYGAYRVPTGGTFRHVLINQDGTAIRLITTTRAGREAIQNLQFLSLLPRDSTGNIVLTQQRWRDSPTTYSEEVLAFFLDAREE